MKIFPIHHRFDFLCVSRGISHSALSDMQTIEQEYTLKPSSSSSSSHGFKYNFESDNNDEFFDDYNNFNSCNFGMYRNENKNLDSLFFDGNSGRDRYTSNGKESKTNQDSGVKDFT